MKKLLLIIGILMISISSFSQPMNLLSTHYSIKNENGWQPWTPATVLVSVDFGVKTIKIHCQQPQMINFGHLEETECPDRLILQGLASDQDGTIVGLTITAYNSGLLFICVSYSNVEYMYKFKLSVEEDATPL